MGCLIAYFTPVFYHESMIPIRTELHPNEIMKADLLKDGICVERARRDDSRKLPNSHCHDYHEIYYLMNGERRFFIKDTAYDIQKGAMVLIKPNVIHCVLDLGDPAHERMLVLFRGRFLSEIFADERLLAPFQDPSPVFRLDVPNRYLLEDLITRMLAEFRIVDSYSRGLCPVLLYELLVMIARMTERIHSEGSGTAETGLARFHAISRYLCENYTEKITLRHLSERFHLSPYHLCRRFKETTGLSVIRYLNQVRILEAQKLLRTGGVRVAELAGKVGFDNISHFGRTFKRLIGVSPMRYRRIAVRQTRG